jgi:hypothetical protein
VPGAEAQHAAFAPQATNGHSEAFASPPFAPRANHGQEEADSAAFFVVSCFPRKRPPRNGRSAEPRYITFTKWYHRPMERTQISLSSAQARELRRLARQRKVSMAALIRDAVDRQYGTASSEDVRWERALASIGGFRSGVSETSEHHDEALADAFEQ